MLAAAGILGAIQAESAALDRPLWKLPHRDFPGPLQDTHWNDTATLAVAAAVAFIGLVLLLAGLIPGKPGPQGGHKLTGEVVSHLEELLAADPRLRPADLAAAAGQRFGVTVHPRSVERALQRRREARNAAGPAGEDAPKS